MENLIEELLQLAEECIPINLGSLKNSLYNIIKESEMMADYGVFNGKNHFFIKGGYFLFEFEQMQYTVYFVPYIKDIGFEYFGNRKYHNDENVVIVKIVSKTTEDLRKALFINKRYCSDIFEKDDTKVICKTMKE